MGERGTLKPLCLLPNVTKWSIYIHTVNFLTPSGYRTFVGYICMEFMYNNAILRSFVQLLWEAVEVGGGGREGRRRRGRRRLRRRVGGDSSTHASVSFTATVSSRKMEGEEALPAATTEHRNIPHCVLPSPCMASGESEVLSLRARNRWWLAYTLLHNPSLLPLRQGGGGGAWGWESGGEGVHSGTTLPFKSGSSDSLLSNSE